VWTGEAAGIVCTLPAPPITFFPAGQAAWARVDVFGGTFTEARTIS
jgi:hypothetical protein